MTSALPSRRPLSQEAHLFFWWDSQPPGHGATMHEMMQEIGAHDPQIVRNALVKLRKGEVPDPSSRGSTLRPLPIRYSPDHDRYFDLAKVNHDVVASQVPRSVVVSIVKRLLTQALNLESALGKDGLAMSAEQYLDNEDTKELIRQLPMETMWSLHGTTFKITQAKQLLAIEEATRNTALP